MTATAVRPARDEGQGVDEKGAPQWWRHPILWRRELAASLGRAGLFPLAILFGLNMVDEFDRVAFGALSPEIRDAFGLSNSAFLAIVATSSLVPVFFSIPIGVLADRRSRVRLSQAAGVLWATAALTIGLVPALSVVVIARLVGGTGRLVNEPVHPNLLASYYPRDQLPRVFGIHRFANTLGLVAGPVAGVMGSVWGYRSAFVAMAIPTFALLFFSLALKEPPRDHAPEPTTLVMTPSTVPWSKAFRKLSSVRTLRRTWVGAFLFGGIVASVASLSSLFFDEVYGLGPAARGVVTSLTGVSGAVGLAWGTRLARTATLAGRLHRLPWIMGAVLFEFAAGLFLMAVSPWLGLSLFFSFAAGLGVAAYLPSYLMMIALSVPSQLRSQAYSYSLVALAGGTLLITPIGGAISDAAGYRVGLGVLSAVALPAAFTFFTIQKVVAGDVERAPTLLDESGVAPPVADDERPRRRGLFLRLSRAPVLDMSLRDLMRGHGATIALVTSIALLAVVIPVTRDKAAPSSINAAGAGVTAAPLSPSGGAPAPAPAQARPAQPGSATAAAKSPGAPAAGSVGSGTAGAPQPEAATVQAGPAGAAELPTAAGSPAAPAPVPVPGGACRPDGRNAGVSVYMPPCVPFYTGENGGETARGVLPDKIVIAQWFPQGDPVTSSALFAAGISDDDATVRRSHKVWVRYGNTHYETYGREVVYVDVEASGPSTDDAAMRADAVRIAEEVKAFAAVGADPPALAQELAARGVICVCSAGGEAAAYFRKHSGYVFSEPLPLLEFHYAQMAEYIGKRLAGRPAKWSTDPAYQVQERKFGLAWGEAAGLTPTGSDPEWKKAVEYYKSELARYGVTLTKDVSFSSDLSRAGEQSANIITQMKAAGVSNLAYLGTPLFGIFLTKEATRQAYFPEWLHTGYGTSDSTFFGRANDQAQWRSSFGVSSLWLFWSQEVFSPGYREYHHSCPEVSDQCDPGTEGELACCYRWLHELLFMGIQRAGPALTTQTFAEGVYSYPPTGGTPKAPTHHYTPDNPTATKDFIEIWWDPTGTAEDEVGNTGPGRMMKVVEPGGHRYRLGDWPATDPQVFDSSRAVYTSDDIAYGTMTFPHEEDGHTHVGIRCLSC